MAHWTGLLSLMTVLFSSTSSSGTTIHFSVPIEAAQAVPTPDPLSPASGIATFQLHLPDTPSGSVVLDYHLQFFGLDLGDMSGFPDNSQTVETDDDVTSIHIHNAGPGETGEMFFGIVNPNDDADIVVNITDSIVSGTWDDADVEFSDRHPISTSLDELFSGQLYLNIHTKGNSLSDIRAQLTFAIPEPTSLGLALICAVIACLAVCGGQRTRRSARS